MTELVQFVSDLVTNPSHARWIAPLLLAGEALLCPLIIWKVPYTEIDWTTYMQQVKIFLAGESTYTKISGSTGPLVYPALHVYIYSALYYLTDHGANLLKGQIIFSILYLLVISVVFSCYVRVGAPPYLLPLLVLSKRLHSIFLLRLFNDCWAVLGLWGSIWCLQRGHWKGGLMIWSFGVAVKMTVLVAAPAMGMIALQSLGNREALLVGAVLPQIQVALAIPFMIKPGDSVAYFKQAFDFSRAFLYKWTVNFRFLSEETFLSKQLSYTLLFAHATLLLTFFQSRWIAPSRSSDLLEFAKRYIGTFDWRVEDQIAKRVSAKFVTDTVLGCMAIGMLCARSLHYQFFVYVSWGTPYLLWRSGVHPIAIYAVWAIQEWAWLTYPSTNASSLTVIAILATQVAAMWYGSGPSQSKGDVAYDFSIGDNDSEKDGFKAPTG